MLRLVGWNDWLRGQWRAAWSGDPRVGVQWAQIEWVELWETTVHSGKPN